MRRALVAALLVFAMAGCTSMADAGGVGLLEPEIRVRQLSGQLLPRVDVATDVNLQIDLLNRSAEPIVLERIELRSTPTSEVIFRSSSRQLHEEILPGELRTVDFWVEARLEDRSSGSVRPASTGGTVVVRGTAVFDSPAGRFRTVFIEPVVEGDAGSGQEE